MNNVFLIGFMASGKSTVGRRLSRLLARPFLDTDAEIEKGEGRSIRGIFSSRGEKEFRRLEEGAIRRASRLRGSVISVGGGAVLRPGNVRAMRRAGTVVYLAAPAERLWARLGCGGAARRPLLKGPDARSVMVRLLSVRRPLYRKAAHFTVRAGGAPEEVARRIARRLA